MIIHISPYGVLRHIYLSYLQYNHIKSFPYYVIFLYSSNLLAKKKNLIRQFGGIQEVQRASIEDLLTIDGINKSLAERIYNFFNAG